MTLRTIRADEAVETLKEITSRVGGDLLWLRPDQWRLRSSQARTGGCVACSRRAAGRG